MISLQSDQLLEATVGQFMIEADKVAHVQVGNNLEHALLVLTKTGYTAIPVLDASYRLHGLIGTNMIMNSIFGLERIEFEKLDQITVEEVMVTDIPRLHINDPIMKGSAWSLITDLSVLKMMSRCLKEFLREEWF